MCAFCWMKIWWYLFVLEKILNDAYIEKLFVLNFTFVSILFYIFDLNAIKILHIVKYIFLYVFLNNYSCTIYKLFISNTEQSLNGCVFWVEKIYTE